MQQFSPDRVWYEQSADSTAGQVSPECTITAYCTLLGGSIQELLIVGGWTRGSRLSGFPVAAFLVSLRHLLGTNARLKDSVRAQD